MTARTLQVTLTASATQIYPTADYFNQMTIQNNAQHNCRLGDSTVTASRGLMLMVGGQFNAGPFSGSQGDASQFYIAGTAGDVIDVLLQ
jgi:hypothetical protein